MKYLVLFSLLVLGCAPSLTKLDEPARTFSIASDYESSFQKCIYFLSKESFLIIQADKSTGFIATGYKDINPNRTLRLNVHLNKISEDSTSIRMTIYSKNKGSDLLLHEQEQYQQIINAFTIAGNSN